MKKIFLQKKLPLLLLASGLVITVTFSQTTAGSNKKTTSDTLPKKEKQIRDLDDALLELDKGEAEMQKAMKEFDRDKMDKEIRQAMKGLDVDMAKMKKELAEAMKEIDAQKINAEVQKSMADVQKELAGIDAEKIKAQVQAALAGVDAEKMKADLAKVKEMDFSKLKKELANIRPEIEKSLLAAKKDMAKAKEEMMSYKGLVDALDKDGLLKKTGNYKVEYKDGELTVDGKKLSADETKKFNEFLSGKKEFTLQKNEEGMNINNK